MWQKLVKNVLYRGKNITVSMFFMLCTLVNKEKVKNNALKNANIRLGIKFSRKLCSDDVNKYIFTQISIHIIYEYLLIIDTL